MNHKSQENHDIIEFLVTLIEHSEMEMNGNGKDGSPAAGWQNREMASSLKRFLDRMPGGFFAYHADESEEIIYANQAMIRLFNCKTLEEFREQTGNSFRGIVHPDDLEAVEKSIWEQIEASCYDLDYVEYRIIPRGGGVRWIDDYGHFVRSSAVGGVFYVFAGDATDRKMRQKEEKERLLEEKIREEHLLKTRLEEYGKKLELNRREQLRRLEVIEGLSTDYESIFYVDLDSNRIKAYRVSGRFEKYFSENNRERDFAGFDAGYIEEWVYPDDRELLCGFSDPAYLREKLAVEKTCYINYRIYRNGQPAYMQLRAVDVGNEEHVSQVVLGYRNTDNEVRKEMSQKQMLVDALQEANRAYGAKELFLSNMSHDIRTPMNAIMGFASLARRQVEDGTKTAEYLDMIAASGNQLLQLLNDVLEISKIESAQVHVEESECSLIDILQEIQKKAFPRAQAKRIAIALDISNLRHDSVYADRGRVAEILSYLVDNALKYTEEKGRIMIAVTETEERQDNHTSYRFVVEDNGIGIDEEFMKRIFEPFEREKNTTLSGVLGTGLGLTITKKLVDMMGGRIYVSSVVGKGSRFTVSLPFRVGKPSVEEAAAGGLPEIMAGRKVLLVDDNEINLEIESEMLKDAGFTVETAEDGSIALEMLRQAGPGQYGLILMDIQMPVMDGYSAARAIRKIEEPELAGIPIIAVSANTFEEDRKKSLESGMNAHLAKPLDMEQLFVLLRKFLV